MTRPRLEVADVVRRFGARLTEQRPELVTTAHRRVLHDIATCRTAERGGHVYVCDHCGVEKHAYNSCRNRHCPSCGASKRAEWTDARRADLLPVQYFHVVFTLPHELAPIALQNKRLFYGMLFEAASKTLLTLAADTKHLGARIGLLAVLHTWGQTLEHHPHLHCIVPGGGLRGDRWVSCRKDFLLPIAVMRTLLRGKFMALLEDAYARGELRLEGRLAHLKDAAEWRRLSRAMRRQKWVVYTKPPFGGPEQVLKYLARYTHRVAIGNSRLIAMDDDTVTFRWKDYRDGENKLMQLGGEEFLRRFLLHVLPVGFVRIRHYGLLSNKTRKASLEAARRALDASEPQPAKTASPSEPPRCVSCGVGVFLVLRELLPARGPTRRPGGFDTS